MSSLPHYLSHLPASALIKIFCMLPQGECIMLTEVSLHLSKVVAANPPCLTLRAKAESSIRILERLPGLQCLMLAEPMLWTSIYQTDTDADADADALDGEHMPALMDQRAPTGLSKSFVFPRGLTLLAMGSANYPERLLVHRLAPALPITLRALAVHTPSVDNEGLALLCKQCPLLVSLQLPWSGHDHRGLTWDGSLSQLTALHELADLNIRRSSCSDSDLAEIATKLPALTSLDVGTNYPKISAAVCDALSPLSGQLRALSLSEIFEPDAMPPASEWLRVVLQSTRLEWLDLFSLNIGNEALSLVAQFCRGLRFLGITFTAVTPKGVASLHNNALSLMALDANLEGIECLEAVGKLTLGSADQPSDWNAEQVAWLHRIRMCSPAAVHPRLRLLCGYYPECSSDFDMP